MDIIGPIDDTVEPASKGQLLPLDDFLDRAHPASDQYMQSVEGIQRQIIYVAAKLRPKQVQLIKAVFAGATNTDAAKQYGTTPPTVGKLLKHPDAQELLNLLQYHQNLIEGPNLAQRRNMLWRIAVREEVTEPKTSIASIAALNKMNYDEHQINNPATNTQPQINIVISDLLPKGALD